MVEWLRAVISATREMLHQTYDLSGLDEATGVAKQMEEEVSVCPCSCSLCKSWTHGELLAEVHHFTCPERAA